MIEVEQLSAWYGRERLALDDVAFRIEPGEVVGLLGANGAGKTTLLRILAGLHHPQKGRVSVAGCDVVRQRLAAQRAIGYLPEEAALDGEFRVAEYLQGRAALKGLASSSRRARVAAVCQQVGLSDHSRRLISHLSKGYRQRLGLADALLSAPPVLLLDEPTDGLDPSQRAQTLRLIAELSPQHTVLLSTHVLPEAESICQRVLILDAGRLVASGTPAQLSAAAVVQDRIQLRCRGEASALLAAIATVPGVVHASLSPDPYARPAPVSAEGQIATLDITVELQENASEHTAERLARAVLQVGELSAMTPQRTSLDALFRLLTRAV